MKSVTLHLLTCRQMLQAAVLVFAALAAVVAQAGAFDEFFQAAKVDHPEKIQALLARGLDPNIIEEQRGETGMMLALRSESMRSFKVLLHAPGINIETKAHNGDTALMIAAYKANNAAVQALLAKGAQVNRPGWTALHYAAAAGDPAIVAALLDKYAYIDAVSPNGTTPLMMAARGGHILTVKLLLDKGADAMLKNEQGLTVIDFANQFGHKDIAEGVAFRLKKAGKLR